FSLLSGIGLGVITSSLFISRCPRVAPPAPMASIFASSLSISAFSCLCACTHAECATTRVADTVSASRAAKKQVCWETSSHHSSNFIFHPPYQKPHLAPFFPPCVLWHPRRPVGSDRKIGPRCGRYLVVHKSMRQKLPQSLLCSHHRA